MQVKEIKQLFEQYGYEILDECQSYIVFAVKHSLYPGVDIVQLASTMSNDAINELQDEYSRQRFAVRLCKYEDLDKIEDFLFDWFFQVEKSNKSIGVRYKAYGKGVLDSYGISDNDNLYSYIESPYTIEENILSHETGKKEDLVDSIYRAIETDGPTLIIVEAAAGFGKTSTAIELLKKYESVKKGVRHFYMELYKDRQASTFRYLFLSQMHREFDVLLGDDIVYYNIKKGRIPLIIDGFDELLSEDLDLGNTKKAKRKGDTMLSTIAELLVENAKIILTTRKTAILSGQDFLDWYNKRLQDNQVRVIRYALDQPRVDDWLKSWQLKEIPNETYNLLNPVLLGYLHYLSDEDFLKECSSSVLINSYLNKLLSRELDRQDLTISVEDQKIIFERLSSAFAYDDIQSDSRKGIKDSIMLMSYDIISSHETSTKDVDSIANTLVNHALLDRKGNNNIGFVNDFVLGVFLGLSLIDNVREDLSGFYGSMSPAFIDKVLRSMSLADSNTRDSVWIQMVDRCKNLHGSIMLQADLMLQKKSMSNYKDETFDGNNYYNISLGDTNSKFENCHFANIVFTESSINLEFFKDCEFINCKFYRTNIDINSPNADFFQCSFDGTLIPMYVPQNNTDIIEPTVDDRFRMLNLYSLVGNSGRKMQLISRIRNEYQDKKLFKKVFSQLVNESYIVTNGDISHITDKGLNYLRDHRRDE